MYFNKYLKIKPKTIVKHCLFLFLFLACNLSADNMKINKEIIDIQQVGSCGFKEFLRDRKKHANDIKHGNFFWNNISNENLLNIIVTSSSNLKNFYSKNVIDGKVTTAWVEAKQDEGKGEWIRIVLRKKRAHRHMSLNIAGISIFPGLGIEKYFKKNNRIKTLICKLKYKNKVYKYRLYFKDEFKIATFQFENIQNIDIAVNDPIEFTFIIEDVYKGSKWNDTCISEINFVGGAQDERYNR